MSYYDFQISKSKISSELILNKLEDTYEICVIGYIKSYMYEYYNVHSRLVLQIIGFVDYFAKYNNLQKQPIKNYISNILLL